MTFGGGASTPPPLAPIPVAPPPPPMMSAGAANQKPQPKSKVPTFLSDAMQGSPGNTGQKKLTGE